MFSAVSPDFAYEIGVAGTLIGALATYFVARRTHSGNIKTTEAETLWVESQNMRKELRDEVIDLRKRLAQRDTELIRIRKRLRELERRLGIDEYDLDFESDGDSS